MSEPVVKKSQLRIWFLIPFIVFIGLVVMLFFRLGKPTDIVPDNALNRPVPSFSLPLLSDTSQTVSNDVLPEGPYLINVWGSWCPTCIVEHPYLLQLQQEGVDIVGVNYQDELENATAYLDRENDPFVFSVQDYEGDLAIDLGLTGAPETFVVDGEGNIRQHIIGEINNENWQARIAPCLDHLEQIEAEQTDINDAIGIAAVCR